MLLSREKTLIFRGGKAHIAKFGFLGYNLGIELEGSIFVEIWKYAISQLSPM